MVIFELEGKDMEFKERRFVFWEMVWNLLEMGMMFILFLFTFYWFEFRYMVIFISKGS